MNKNKWTLLLGVVFAGLIALVATAADEPAKADGDTLVVTTDDGKEHKLTTWNFTSDTRRLAWLTPKEKPANAPEALMMRELDSSTWAEGVVTLVPLDRLRTLKYDQKAETVQATAVVGPKATDLTTLNGATGYKNTNRPTLEGAVDKTADKMTFLCGVEKGIKLAKFPEKKIMELPAAPRPAVLTTRRNEEGRTTHKLGDFMPLYHFEDGHEVLSPILYTKSKKIEMAKITKITRTAGADGDIVWILSFAGADDEVLTLDKMPKIETKEATLAGFIGRVPVGYKLIQPLIIQDVEFDLKD